MRPINLAFALLWLCGSAIVQAQPVPSDQQGRPATSLPERYAPDRVLVKFKPGTAAAQVAEAHRGAAGVAIDSIPGIEVAVVRVPAGSVLAKVAAYQANPNVLYAEPDYYRLLVVPNEEPGPTPVNGANYFEEQWYLNNTGQRHTLKQTNIFGQTTFKSTTGTPDADIDAPEAWDIRKGTGSSDSAGYATAKVAVLDSGADCATLELSGKCLEKVDFVGNQAWDLCSASDPACDNLGHGTFTASEIVANTDNGEGIAGAAWHTSAGIFKVCYTELVTDGINLFFVGLCPVSASTAAIVAAASDELDAGGQVVRSQYHVISMSYGSDWIDPTTGEISPTTPSNAECDAAQYAHDNGLVLVAGAGNNGDTQRFYPAACTDASGESTVIAVAASDHHDYRASFSTYSQINDPWVSLSAPGENIIGILPDAQCGLASGTDSCVDWWDGTSMATPLVSGGAALVWADLLETLKASGAQLKPSDCVFESLPCNQVVRRRLENGADKVGAQGQNMQEWTRHGRLNLYGALTADSAPPPPPPAPLEAPALSSLGVLSDPSGNQTVYLSWSYGSTSLTGFDIERSTLHKSGRIVATLVIPLSGGALRSYTDDPPSGRYSYRVRARNGEQESAWSAMSDIVAVSDGGSGGGKGGGKPNK